MFPDWFIALGRGSFHYSKQAGHWMKRALWFCSSSLLVLVIPILVQLEMSQTAEMQADHTREVNRHAVRARRRRTPTVFSPPSSRFSSDHPLESDRIQCRRCSVLDNSKVLCDNDRVPAFSLSLFCTVQRSARVATRLFHTNFPLSQCDVALAYPVNFIRAETV